MGSNPEVPMPFLSACTIDVILTDLANASKFVSTLADYEELAGRFAPIRNVE